MPFSHHSHSGQFCPGHARDALEDVIRTAISKKMQTFCLTEHMPRHEEDRYPEEIDAGDSTESMYVNQAAYFEESVRLREKYKSQINLPIGFEIDYCRPSAGELIERSLSEHAFDFFMGSLHHVQGIPIDYDTSMYVQARDACGGTDEAIFAAYFEEQYAMLQALRPLVVGHFDLIRLKSDSPNGSFGTMPTVWPLILRNLDFVVSYGGILEINSAALRKGMTEPYPKLEICKEFRQRGGRFCLSDDSHGVEQVAYDYATVLTFLRRATIDEICYLHHAENANSIVDDRFPHTEVRGITIQELEQHPFWTAN